MLSPIRLASKSGSSSSLLKKLIVARSQADYPRSLERAARLKNWRSFPGAKPAARWSYRPDNWLESVVLLLRTAPAPFRPRLCKLNAISFAHLAAMGDRIRHPSCGAALAQQFLI